jgi:hypothetical protein
VSCEETRGRLPLLLVDLMEPEEAGRLREHLNAGCPACASEVAAAREVLDLLPLALEPENPSPVVRARLVAAARKDDRDSRGERSKPAAASRAVWLWALVSAAGAALIAGFLASGLTSSRLAGEIASLRAGLETARTDSETREGEVATLQDRLRRARTEMDALRSRDLAAVSLVPQEEGRDASATVLWDRPGGRWHLRVWDMPPAGPGRIYQLWAITAGDRVPIAAFNTDLEGHALLSASLPDGLGLLVAAGISEEPEGGSPKPTGPMRLLGQIR